MENGLIYSRLIDPILKPLHQRVLNEIDEGSVVLDFACGTGSLAIKLAAKAKQVIGIDHSPSMLKIARESLKKNKITNLEFIESDIIKDDLSQIPEVDVTIISMAIHQFSKNEAMQLFQKMKQISPKIIVVDYHYPQPKNLAGLLIRLAERVAGKEHNFHFRNYLKNNGLAYYQNEHALDKKREIVFGKGAFSITTLMATEF